jgi:hypothetical protein
LPPESTSSGDAGIIDMDSKGSDGVALISVRGKRRMVPAISVGPTARVILLGGLLKTGYVHDEFWLQAKSLPKPEDIVTTLRESGAGADLFTFAQKLPDVSPKYAYHLEWNTLAVAKFDSYAEWFDKQINRSVRKHIRKAEREGIGTEVVPFTDDLVRGVCEVYDELPVRQGRAFWHYGKGFEAVKSENATYLERSTFIGAYHNRKLVGFLKLVFDDNVASIMQILSKSSYFDKRPTNALLAKAVQVCDSREIKYLTYGEYIYDNKDQSTLIDFKRNNGFIKVDVPRYYVPLTLKGRIALKVGLHKGMKTILPASLMSYALHLRAAWHGRKVESQMAEAQER